MERIVIIDHDAHQVYIEDVDEDLLNEQYGGEEEEYIKDNYPLVTNFSWEYVVGIYYYPTEGDPIDVEPTDLL